MKACALKKGIIAPLLPVAQMAENKIKLNTATYIVIANMIGTGVFTSLGYQLLGVQSGFAILLLWLLGGVIALCGALSYGELASAMPRSGGEYHYLSKIFHPLLGFLSGWVSVTVGFAAPVALAALALGDYVNKVFPSIHPGPLASAVVILITLVHSFTIKRSAFFQDMSTILKIALIVLIAVAGFVIGKSQHISILPQTSSIKEQDWTIIFSSAFAGSLNYIYYAYSGWNASAYIANDIDNPSVNIPKSLFRGTIVVTVLYVVVNYVFLRCAPISAMIGQDKVGYEAAAYIFGNNGGNIMAILIALTLVSSVSSMAFIGPRVSQVMGEDLPQIGFLAKKNKYGTPATAVLIQGAITLIIVNVSSFQNVLVYISFTLNLMTFLTVLGLFVMRSKRNLKSGTYKTFGYPVTPIIFLILSAWTLYFTMKNEDSRMQALLGLATVVAGSIIYFIRKPSNV